MTAIEKLTASRGLDWYIFTNLDVKEKRCIGCAFYNEPCKGSDEDCDLWRGYPDYTSVDAALRLCERLGLKWAISSNRLNGREAIVVKNIPYEIPSMNKFESLDNLPLAIIKAVLRAQGIEEIELEGSG